jgi:hypothetical protein
VKDQRAMRIDNSAGAIVWRVWGWPSQLSQYWSPAALKQPPAADSLLLFTPQEARQLRWATGEWLCVPRARALSIGPQIVVRRPRIGLGEAPRIEAESPTDLDVVFESRGAPVRMDSLSVEARKGFFSKSLNRNAARPHIRGDSIELGKVEIPTGRFMLKISIADANGDPTDTTYRLEIGRE